MRMNRSTRLVTALAATLLLGPAMIATAQDGFVRVQPEDITWTPRPDGLQQAVVSGDPTQPGIYVIRVKFAPGVMTRPHFHGEDRFAVVLKGTWWTGIGDVYAPEKTVAVKTGGFMKHPAGGHHYDGAKDEEVVVQITGMGPSTTTQVTP
jgi:uncharacterized RmlC-like cupin family protein